jgi:Carboxypeptidase regulatory-like domain
VIVIRSCFPRFPSDNCERQAVKGFAVRCAARYECLFCERGSMWRNYVFAETTLEVAAGEEPTVNLVLRKAVRFGGRAVLQGSNDVAAPLSGLRIRLALAHPSVPSMVIPSGILDAATGSDGMFSFNISESEYRVVFFGLAEDAYLISAKQNGKDILSGTVQISGDSEVEIIAASDGGVVDGLVKNAAGESMPGAIVALVPESSLRNRGDLYRTATSDQSGRFVLHGIAPGTYKLFAWMNAEGIAPFRNAKFMKKYEELGREIQFTRSQRATSSIQLADEEP